MQSLTRNNHITSNHLPLLLFTPVKRYIHSYIFHCISVFLHQCKHCCLHQNHISVQPCIKDVRFDSSMGFIIVQLCKTIILNGIKKILSIEDYMCKSSCYLVFFIKSWIIVRTVSEKYIFPPCSSQSFIS